MSRFELSEISRDIFIASFEISFEVDDLRKQLKILKELNIRMIDEKPRLGVGGCEIAFVHPDSTGGVLVELSQPLPEKSL